MQMIFVPHRKHTYKPPRPVTRNTGTIDIAEILDIRMSVSLCDHEDYEEREKWVVVRDTTGGGNRIYHRF
jgi:hypothetical protein